MIGNILDNTTELYMIQYTFGEIFSSGGATLYKNPSDRTVLFFFNNLISRIFSVQMVPNSPTAKIIEEALCTLLKTPVKEKQQQNNITASNNSRIPQDNSSLKKTPLSKLSKKSPMPSPFLGSPHYQVLISRILKKKYFQ